MIVIKDFEMRVAVGVKGFALMEIGETLSPHSIYVGNDVHPSLIIEDIKEIGIEEWAECALNDVPVKPGIYTFRGTARFSEDDITYYCTCDQVIALEKTAIGDV